MLTDKSCSNKYIQSNLENSGNAKLDCTDTFPDDLLMKIYAIYKEASDLKFKIQAMHEHQA
eukprot:15366604-Ditylum_brightwellii.AAC.1